MHRPLDLNFHKDSLDGRNRCLSLSPYGLEYPNGEPYRCELDRNHALEHSSHGKMWSDKEERKNMMKYYIWDKLIIVFGLILVFAGLIAMVMTFVDPTGKVPLWYEIMFWGSVAGVVVGLIGVGISEFREGK